MATRPEQTLDIILCQVVLKGIPHVGDVNLVVRIGHQKRPKRGSRKNAALTRCVLYSIRCDKACDSLQGDPVRSFTIIIIKDELILHIKRTRIAYYGVDNGASYVTYATLYALDYRTSGTCDHWVVRSRTWHNEVMERICLYERSHRALKDAAIQTLL